MRHSWLKTATKQLDIIFKNKTFLGWLNLGEPSWMVLSLTLNPWKHFAMERGTVIRLWYLVPHLKRSTFSRTGHGLWINNCFRYETKHSKFVHINRSKEAFLQSINMYNVDLLQVTSSFIFVLIRHAHGKIYRFLTGNKERFFLTFVQVW